ncbi:MAG: hypothetical protein KGN76_18145 [Acidobacteriota bacterium]|nr:hypothetical protein [Acidobacteriota bacterium]
MRRCGRPMYAGSFIVAVLAWLCTAGPAAAQNAQSPAAAKSLVSALDQAKLQAIAAADPANPGVYVAALYYPGAELLVVQAKYSAPAAMEATLASKDYREAYVDLNGAAEPGTKIFIEDLKADGLNANPGNDQPFDSYDAGTQHAQFNHDWKAQKMSEDQYKKIFQTADQQYEHMLTVLLGALKKPS